MRTLNLTALAATLALCAPAIAAPEAFVLDPSHTSIVWSINHMGYSNPYGKFRQVEGDLTLDEEKPESSKLSVTVGTASVASGVDLLDEHLRGDKFFNSTAHPKATFVSDKVELTGKDTAKVYGTFTMLGVSKPLVLDVKLNKIGDNPFTHKKTAGFSATTSLKRSDYGMNEYLPMLGDDVKLIIESEATIK